MTFLQTQSDVARRLGISRQAVNRYVQRKEIPLFWRDDGSIYFDEEEIVEWFLSRPGPKVGIRR